jgi:pimeloyl-ACP methyl ester carboxylesterase
MGGYVALALARAAAARVTGLVIAGSRAGADAPERRAIRNRMIELLEVEGVEGYRAAAPSEVPPDVTAADLAGALAVLRDRPDATDTLRAFARPFLVVVGEDDELLGADEARAIAALAPGGRAEVVPGAGHLVSRERPADFNALLLEFLRPWT